MPLEEEIIVPMEFPAQGLDDGTALSSVPPGFTPIGQNVRFFENLTERGRGGSRSGIERFIDEQVSGNNGIQGLFVVVRTDGNALAWSYNGIEPPSAGIYGGIDFEDLVPPPDNPGQPGDGGAGFPPNPNIPRGNIVIYFALFNDVDPAAPDPPRTPATCTFAFHTILGDTTFGSLTTDPEDNISDADGVTTVVADDGTYSYINAATPTDPPLFFEGTNINLDGSDSCNWNTEQQQCRTGIPSGSQEPNSGYTTGKWRTAAVANDYVPFEGAGEYGIDLAELTFASHSLAAQTSGARELRVTLTAGENATGYVKVIAVNSIGTVTILLPQAEISVNTGSSVQDFAFVVP